MSKLEIFVKGDVDLPEYATDGAAGFDLAADLTEAIELAPGESRVIPTGLFMEIPGGYELQVRPRSGLAAKHSVTVLNAPGTIDSDYRGNIGVILINHGKQTFTVEPKMRIAQGVIAPVTQAVFLKANELAESGRGERGFGHTGFH